MEKIFFINMDSLFPMLFWGNVISFFFLCIYRCKNKFDKEKQISGFLIAARLCHAFYYFVASGRDILPDWLSVNIGIAVLLLGFYFEAHGILLVIKENSKIQERLLLSALIAAVVSCNVFEFIVPFGGIRITTASLGTVVIMAVPVVRMLFARDRGVYTKSIAAFYIVFILLLVVRAWIGLQNQSMGILTTTVLQSVTFLSLFLQLMIALPSYTLIIKNYSDEALLLMATTDRLTGTTNRHAFSDAAEAVFNNGKHSPFPVSVLFLDIDHFKKVNDKYGHVFGDAVLVRMAEIIDKCLRKSDLSCRYGGEEFVVLLPHTDNQAAYAVAERIMNEVRQARFDGKPEFSFTASIGIFSCVPSEEQNFKNAIDFADKAMYKAKQTGRDRIVRY